MRRAAVLREDRRAGARVRHLRRARSRLRRHLLRRLEGAVDHAGRRARATSPSSSSPCRRATTWRAGASASWSATSDLVNALARIKGYHDYGTFTPIQVAAIAALEGPQECVAEIAMTLSEAPRRAGQGPARGRLDGRHARRRRCTCGRRFRKRYRAAGLARVHQAAPRAGEGLGVAGHRLRRVRRRPRAASRMIENESRDAAGDPRHQADVPRRRMRCEARAMAERCDEAAAGRACSASAPSGAARGTVLRRNEEEITRRAGRPIRITLDRRRERWTRARARRAASTGVSLTSRCADGRSRHRDIDIVVRADRRHRAGAHAHACRPSRTASTSSPPTRRCSRDTATRSSPPRTREGVMVAFEGAPPAASRSPGALREGLTSNT